MERPTRRCIYPLAGQVTESKSTKAFSFHPHAQRNGFHHRGAHPPRRLFTSWNPSLTNRSGIFLIACMDNVHCLNRVARHAKRRRKNYENCSRCCPAAYGNSDSKKAEQREPR